MLCLIINKNKNKRIKGVTFIFFFFLRSLCVEDNKKGQKLYKVLSAISNYFFINLTARIPSKKFIFKTKLTSYIICQIFFISFVFGNGSERKCVYSKPTKILDIFIFFYFSISSKFLYILEI